jgi:hypothetical protein
MGMSFTIAVVPRQRSHSQVRIPRESWPHFTVSDSRLYQLGGPDSRIYIAQKQSGLVIPPATGFPFRRLVRLAGIRWKDSTPPPHEIRLTEYGRSSHRASERTYREHRLQNFFYCCVTWPRTRILRAPLSNGCTRHVSWHLLYCCVRTLLSDGWCYRIST